MPGELLVKPTSAMQIGPAAGGRNDINLYLIVGIHSLWFFLVGLVVGCCSCGDEDAIANTWAWVVAE